VDQVREQRDAPGRRVDRRRNGEDRRRYPYGAETRPRALDRRIDEAVRVPVIFEEGVRVGVGTTELRKLLEAAFTSAELQVWASKEWGGQFIPRIDMEVPHAHASGGEHQIQAKLLVGPHFWRTVGRLIFLGTHVAGDG